MPGVYMICMEMYGNGVATGTEIILGVALQTLRVLIGVIPGFCAVARGSALQATCAVCAERHTAPLSGTATSDFGASRMLQTLKKKGGERDLLPELLML